jgi:RIO kinase 1
VSTIQNDDYDQFEEQFDPMRIDRQARRSRKVKQQHQPKKVDEEVIQEIADTEGLEGGFKTTYQPSKYEQGWLLSSIKTFYDQQLITDVLSLVRGGKEASVYCCEADPSTGLDLIAAKVYRPRMFRQLRNDKMYREGRDILTSEGRAVKKTDHRIMRAVGKKTAFGAQVSHTSWLMHEYNTLEHLYDLGAAVPKPIGHSENAILMSYCGDEEIAAAPLSEIQLESDEVEPLFAEVMRNIELMLKHHMIHGDLSAYNILYWDGQINLIDFPQVTNSQTNINAYAILQRDITRVCEYFARQGVRHDPDALTHTFWEEYVKIRPEDWLVE